MHIPSPSYQDFTGLFKNTRILKFKSQLMFAFFTAVNHLCGLLRKQVYIKGFERSLFVIGGFRSVIIEKHNCEGSF